MTSIEIAAKPIIFRASYRDINMIMAIINKAISLYGSTQKPSLPSESSATEIKGKTAQISSEQLRTTEPQQQTVGKAHVLMSKEQVMTIILLLIKSQNLKGLLAQGFI